MAGKKKLSKKQRQEQRRAAMERVRQERGWTPPAPPRQQSELLDDMLPLLPGINDPSAPMPSVEPVIDTLMGSWDLAKEPEFEDIIVDPLLCVDTYVDAVEAMGHSPDSLLELSEQEQETIRLESLVQTVKQLLTADRRRQILAGLDHLRVRLKEAGDRQEAARAAMLFSFLDHTDSNEIWALAGLAQAIFYQSVVVGFEMTEAGVEVMEATSSSEEPDNMLARLTSPAMTQKAESLLKRAPGLSKYLAKQADIVWDEGLEAVYQGDLYLGIYSKEELLAGIEAMRQPLTAATEAAQAKERDEADVSEEKSRDLALQLARHVTGLFTPERLDQLRSRLAAVLEARTVGKKRVPFVLMLKQYMDDPDAVDNEQQFLVSAFLGEMRRIGRADTEDDD